MILITRQQEEAIITQQTLLKYNLKSLIEPLIIFKPYLHVQFHHYGEVLLITSKNAIRSLINITNNRDYKIIAIGTATAQFAQSHDFNHVVIAGQDAHDLINYINNHCTTDQRFLYISGKNISYPLDKILTAKGFITTRLIVYNTLYVDQLSSQCLEALINNLIEGVIFFSINTTHTFINLITQYKVEKTLTRINAYSLSNRITQLLNKMMWKRIYTAKKVSHNSLVQTIINS